MRNLGHWLSSWFSLVWFWVLFEAISLGRVVHHMWPTFRLFHKYGAKHLTHGLLLTMGISTHYDRIMCPNRHCPDYPIEDSVHRHSNTNIQRPSHSPWPPRPHYHVIRGRSDHHEQKGLSHTSTERLQLKSPTDWLTRTANRLSTKWVWANGCIYFQGIYGPRWGTCHPNLNTPGHQDIRPSGRSSRQTSWWDKVRRCRA